MATLLKKADVRIYQDYGAAWITACDGACTGATFSAKTGTRIHGDVTGYIEQHDVTRN